MKMKKKSILTSVMSLALVLVAVMGTIAYMTASAELTNTFTIGGFNQPEVDDDNDPNTPAVNAYIKEPDWKDQSVLIPGESIAKNPYVGIGKNSADDAWVYVYVESDFAATESVYFEINTGWEVVSASAITANVDDDADLETVYASGLFKYDTALVSGDADVWTNTALFDVVHVSPEASFTAEKYPKTEMTINAFLHQVNDGGTPIAESDVDAAAVAWAAGL